MALVKYGGGIIQMAGSIGGTTFARNSGGNYARAKTKPIDPNSALQQPVRSAIALLTEDWRETLTAAQRAAWEAYACAVAMQNRLGETIHNSGFNHYIRSNSILAIQGKDLVADGPVEMALPSMDPAFAITASAATQLVSVVFDDAFDWLDEDEAYMWTFCGCPKNATRNFFAGPWRFMDEIAGDSITAPTTPDTQTAPFTLIEGQKIWTYARIQRADGRISEKFRADCIIAA